MIPLQRLEGFYWVARTEGYASAARAFPYPITQPGVHQQVKRLEADLGVKLFERVGRDRVVPSPAGRALFELVAPFLERLKNLEQSIRTGRVGGRLKIHASGHLLRHLLPAWMRRIQARHPEIDLELVEAQWPDVQRVRSGEADLLVDHLHEVPGDLEVRKIASARAYVVVASGHAILRGRRGNLGLKALAGEPFIAYGADHRSRQLQLQALELDGVSPPRVHAADSAETILGFVAAGLGYSIVPSVLPGGPREVGIHAEPLRHAAARFPIHAAWRRTAAENPIIQAAMALSPTAR
jgi:DNA-binding transcriptional LysR family regulator